MYTQTLGVRISKKVRSLLATLLSRIKLVEKFIFIYILLTNVNRQFIFNNYFG